MSGTAYMVEFLGSFGLTFFIGMTRINNKEDILSTALTTFFLVVAFVHMFYKISSAQFNPILTLSLIITNQIAPGKALIYALLQLTGSFMAGSVLYLLNEGKESGTYYGSPQMNAALRECGMVFELASMFLLVMVYNYFMSNPSAPKNVYGTAIASVYLVSIVGFGFLSGGAVNFCFVFGPSIYMDNYSDWGYYFVGHLIGGFSSGPAPY